MFSKTWIFIPGTVLLSACLVLTGCDRFLGGRSKEEDKESATVQITTKEVDCLKKAPDDLQKFFDDEGDAQSVPRSIECIQKSLKTFMRLTRGSQPNAYLSKELQYFFNTFLLKENKISDSFQTEIMRFKAAVVGGSPDMVTRLELEQFIQFLSELQPQLMKLQGNMKLAFFRGDLKRVQPQDILSLKKSLGEVGDFVLEKTKLKDSNYEWASFRRFLEELEGFMVDSKGLKELVQWIDLAEKAKVLFFGPSAQFTSPSEWQSAQKWVINTYVSMLRFYYEIKDRPYETTAEWKVLIPWLDEIITAIETAPAMRKNKLLDAAAIDKLIEKVFTLNLFKTILTPDLVKSTYRKALYHFVEVNSGPAENFSAIAGMTDVHFRILKQEYNVWKMSQLFLIDLYSQHKELQLINLRYYADQPMDLLGKMKVTSVEAEELRKSWKEFRNLLHTNPGVTYGRELKMRIVHLNEIESLPFTGSNMMNAVRSYVRLALRGYGGKDRKMTRQGLIDLESHFRDFGRALGFLDPREKNSASRTFDQGNFFSYHGNGDDYLDFTETYEILSELISGGRSQIDQIYADLAQRNQQDKKCFRDELDIFNRQYVNEDCFYEAFKKNHSVYLSHLPGMVRFLNSLNEDQFHDTYNALMSIAYYKGNDKVEGRLEFTELRTLSVVLNFIETLMVVYDRNNDMLLSEAEVMAAAPRFKDFIAKVSPLKDFLVEDIFLYLVFTGEKPTLADGLKVTGFLAKRYSGYGIGTTGKYNLIQLLSVLNNESK